MRNPEAAAKNEFRGKRPRESEAGLEVIQILLGEEPGLWTIAPGVRQRIFCRGIELRLLSIFRLNGDSYIQRSPSSSVRLRTGRHVSCAYHACDVQRGSQFAAVVVKSARTTVPSSKEANAFPCLRGRETRSRQTICSAGERFYQRVVARPDELVSDLNVWLL